MQYVLTAALVVVAIIHLLPLPGLLGAGKLEVLYGISVADRNLEILMRHRAAMFGVLGAFMLVAAFCPQLQAAALLMGFVSVLSFLGLARSAGGYNASIGRIVAADIVALIALVLGAIAYLLPRAA